MAKADRQHAEAAKKLAELKLDRAMMSITAASDGLVYYGQIENGRWTPASALKVLKVGGKLPSHLPLLTLIPAKTPLTISAFTGEKHLSQLKTGNKGHATTQLDAYVHFPVKVTAVHSYPQTDGTYRVEITPEQAIKPSIVPGMKATIKLTNTKLDKAIIVPKGYLSQAADGSYTVDLKLADGKTTQRQVTIGASNDDHVVITKGLEVAQVILK